MGSFPYRFFDKEFERLSPQHKAIAVKILERIYFESKNGLTANQIYALFNSRHKQEVEKTLDALSDQSIYYIAQVNESLSDSKEKRYILTEYGEEKVLKFYSRF